MADRCLAYSTDLTDEEWQIPALLLCRQRLAVDVGNTPCERCSMASSMCCVLAEPGV
jgi:hypothetical protein